MNRAAQQPASSSDIASRVKVAVGAVLDRKGIEPRVLHIESVCDYTDYLILSSGGSERQVTAIAEAVQERLREECDLRPLRSEGQRQGKWVLLDYGDFVVHVLDPDRRDFYRLERLWSDAPDVTEQFVS